MRVFTARPRGHGSCFTCSAWQRWVLSWDGSSDKGKPGRKVGGAKSPVYRAQAPRQRDCRNEDKAWKWAGNAETLPETKPPIAVRCIPRVLGVRCLALM